MMENSVLSVENKDICLLCLKDTQGMDVHRKVVTSSFKLIAQYVELDIQKIFKISDPSKLPLLEKADVLIPICQHCLIGANLFCELHQEFESIRQKLNKYVKALYHIVLQTENTRATNNPYAKFRRKPKTTPMPNSLNTSLNLHCSSFYEASFRNEIISKCKRLIEKIGDSQINIVGTIGNKREVMENAVKISDIPSMSVICNSSNSSLNNISPQLNPPPRETEEINGEEEEEVMIETDEAPVFIEDGEEQSCHDDDPLGDSVSCAEVINGEDGTDVITEPAGTLTMPTLVNGTTEESGQSQPSSTGKLKDNQCSTFISKSQPYSEKPSIKDFYCCKCLNKLHGDRAIHESGCKPKKSMRVVLERISPTCMNNDTLSLRQTTINHVIKFENEPNKIRIMIPTSILTAALPQGKNSIDSNDPDPQEDTSPDECNVKAKLIFKCPSPECNAQFLTIVEMREHYNSVHTTAASSRQLDNSNGSVAYMEDNLIPTESPSELTDKTEGSPNKNTEDKRRMFPCPECGKSFYHKQSMQIHYRTHTGERPYACGDCGVWFSQRATLNRHMRRVHLPKSNECTECGKKFGCRDYLIKHLRIHTGELPYACLVCKKRCRDKSALNQHTRTHNPSHPPVNAN